MRRSRFSRAIAIWGVCQALVVVTASTAIAFPPPDARVIPLGIVGTVYEDLNLGVPGGTAHVFAPGDPKGWNPHASGNDYHSRWCTSHMYGGLIELDPATGAPVPWLAKSWEISADSLTITFHLRSGLQWSDGQPITADDVVFTYNDVILNSRARSELEQPGGSYPVCRKLDTHTVSFTLPSFFRPLLAGLSFEIMPQHALAGAIQADGLGQAWDTSTDPSEIVVCGPWMVSEYVPGMYILFERNPHYWTYDLAGTQLPYIDRIRARIVPHEDRRLLVFRNDEVHFYEPRPQDIPILQAEAQAKDFTVMSTMLPTYGTTLLMLNQDIGLAKGTDTQKRNLYRNRDFREALARLIDKPTMIANVHGGWALPLWSPVSTPSPFYAGRSHFAGAVTGANAVTYGFTPATAATMLGTLGLIDTDGDGWLELPGGLPLEITIEVISNSTRIGYGLIIQDAWQNAGIYTTLKVVEFDTLRDHLAAATGDAFIFGLTGSDDPHFGRNVYSSCGELHVQRFSACAAPTAADKAIDAHLAAGAVTLDLDTAFQHYVQYQQAVAKQLEMIYLVKPTFQFAHWNTVGNAELANPLSVREDMLGRMMELLYLK